MYAAGFGTFMDSLPRRTFRRSREILDILGERWWDVTSSFHLSMGEMTLTPLDFAVLTGIHVGGTPISIDRRVTITAEGVRAALGHDFTTFRGETIAVGDLHSYLKGMPREITDHTIARRYARCMILMLIGDTIAADQATTVHLWWLPYLRDFSTARHFDWGGYALAALYRSMSLFSRRVTDDHTGYVYAWEVTPRSLISFPFSLYVLIWF